MNEDLKKLLDYERFEIPKTIQILGAMSQRRLKKDKDLVIAISGDEGDGKSTLAILLGVAIDPTFTLETNMVYSNETEEVSNKLKDLPRYSVIIPDEAIKFLYKLNWASAGQKYINLLYALARKENKATILPIPRFTDVNEYFRNHRVRIWIHIVKEGYAVVFQKDWSPFSFRDPWRIYDNEKSIEKIRKKRKFASFTLREKMRILRSCRNFVTSFSFPKLPDTIYGQYKILSESRYEGIDELLIKDKKKSKIPYRNAIVSMIEEMMSKGYDAGRISYITGLEIPRIQKILDNKTIETKEKVQI